MNARDQAFAMLADEDVDFLGDTVCHTVPVLTYRWSRGDAVASLPLDELLRRGSTAMTEIGLKNIRSSGYHLRGDSPPGLRVKMTVLKSEKRSTYFLMTAGMPGTRERAKAVNRALAVRIESDGPVGNASPTLPKEDRIMSQPS